MAEQEINVAQQDTLESVASTVNTINTNAARLTAARATKIDNIGATGDTGGSSTAGTLFGKLNKIISDIATFVGNWTATRAGYIDNIRSYTVTNNTASKTGVLSAKLAYVISLLENTTYGLNALKNTLASNGDWYAVDGTAISLYNSTTEITLTMNSAVEIASFVAPASGIYRVTITSSYTSFSGNDNYPYSNQKSINLKDKCALSASNLSSGKNYAPQFTSWYGGNTTKEFTETFQIYLDKGLSLSMSVTHSGSNATTVTAKIKSVKITYNKSS